MSQGISIDDMAEAIEKELMEYRELAADELKAAVKKAGKTAKSDINKSAPVRTGKYAKSWRMKVTEESAVGIGVTVYSPSHYMLAHLLENGHAKRNILFISSSFKTTAIVSRILLTTAFQALSRILHPHGISGGFSAVPQGVPGLVPADHLIGRLGHTAGAVPEQPRDGNIDAQRVM